MSLFGKPGESKPAAAPTTRPASSAAVPASAGSLARAAAATTTCVIGPKTTVKGDLLGDEDVIIDGNVEGQIRISRDVKIGPTGNVKASVDAQSVVISGELIGDCTAANRIEIQASGKLTGNIRAPKIIIAEGAMFKGSSDMSARHNAS